MRIESAAAIRGSMFDDDRGFVPHRAALAHDRVGQVDLLGGVSESFVETSGVEERSAFDCDRTAEEVCAGPRVVDVADGSAKRMLGRDRHAIRADDAERDDLRGVGTFHEIADAIGRVRRPEDCIVVEEDQHVCVRSRGEQVPPASDAEVLVRAKPVNTHDRLQGRIGCHVRDDDLVESDCGRQGVGELTRPAMTEDREREGRRGHQADANLRHSARYCAALALVVNCSRKAGSA